MFPRIDFVEKHSFVALPSEPQAQIVDLGANHGSFSHELIQRYGCRSLAVEPVPELVAGMPRHPNLTLVAAAISSDATVRISLNDSICASTKVHQEGAGTVEVRGIGLQELLEEHAVERVDLMKVDIEGAEVELFDGLDDALLDRLDQITIEYHDFILLEMAPGVAKIDRRLTGLGFQRIRFSLNNTDVLYLHPRTQVHGLSLVYVLARYKYARGAFRRLATLITKRSQRASS